MGKVTVPPSGHFGKAPSEHSTTFQGPASGDCAAETQVGERRKGRPQPSSSPELAHKVSVPLFMVKGWGKGTGEEPGGNRRRQGVPVERGKEPLPQEHSLVSVQFLSLGLWGQSLP